MKEKYVPENKWIPERKDYQFIWDNLEMLSMSEMADALKVGTCSLQRVKEEMGIHIEDYYGDLGTHELELSRWLNRFGKAKQWTSGTATIAEIMATNGSVMHE